MKVVDLLAAFGKESDHGAVADRRDLAVKRADDREHRVFAGVDPSARPMVHHRREADDRHQCVIKRLRIFELVRPQRGVSKHSSSPITQVLRNNCLARSARAHRASVDDRGARYTRGTDRLPLSPLPVGGQRAARAWPHDRQRSRQGVPIPVRPMVCASGWGCDNHMRVVRALQKRVARIERASMPRPSPFALRLVKC